MRAVQKQRKNSLLITIRDIVKIIGKIVASLPAVMYGPLHYRQLEKEKKVALVLNKGDFDGRMTLSLSAKSELRWWIENTEFACNGLCLQGLLVRREMAA